MERGDVGESLKAIGAITLFVDDPQRSKEFYARVFEAARGRQRGALRFDNLVMNLLKRGAAVDELLGPVQPVEAGASFSDDRLGRGHRRRLHGSR